MPEVDNHGVRIAYDIAGRGEPLVLVHGWSTEGRFWREFGYVGKLDDDFTIIVPDLRGHGRSSRPANRDFSDAAFASDVIAVLDDAGIDRAHVFGYSLGGWVVFELAAAHRQRITTAIVGGAHPYAEDTSWVRTVPPEALSGYWDAAGAPLSNESKRRTGAFSHQELAEMIPDRVDKSVRLAGLGVRWLMMCGTNDARFEDMRRFAAREDGCTFLPIPDADHLQAWFRSDQPASAVRSFVRAAST